MTAADAFEATFSTTTSATAEHVEATAKIGENIRLGMVHESVSPHYKAVAANGEMPKENARRQEVYENAHLAALKTAEPVKVAQDHRLRSQIIELEGLEKTVKKIEVEVGRKLETL